MAVQDLASIRKSRTAEASPAAAQPGRGRVAAVLTFARRRPLVMAALAVAAIVAAGYFIFSETEEAGGQPVIAAAARGDVEDTVTALGSLQPKIYVDVGAQVSGVLKTLAVQVGDRVEKGQLLAEIDSTVQAAKVQADQDQLRGLQASLADKEAQATLAQAQEKRQAALLRIGGTPKDTYEVAYAAARSADAAVKTVEAQIAQAEQTLKADTTTLGYSNIYAPMAGTVVSITSLQGQTLNANQQAPVILRIEADTALVDLRTVFPEQEAVLLEALRSALE